MEPRNQRAAQIACERGWLDSKRAEALLRLGERWKVDLPSAGLEASWLSPDQARELAALCGFPVAAAAGRAQPTENTRRRVPVEGSRVGNYVLEHHLASGAMGAVFVGRLEGVDVRHAVKLMALEGRDDSAIARWARFEREAQSLSRLRHPGIVRVHSFGVVEGGEFGYLSMDLIDGTSLSDLQDGQTLSREAELQICAHLGRTLGHLGEAGIMHRDVKPANVLIRADTGLPVLCDFGLVRGDHDVSLTKTQALLGTPRFMAPELVMGDRAAQGPPTDVFALGVMLYHAQTGSYPFEGDSMQALAGQILNLDPAQPSSLAPGCDPHLDATVLAALAKNPARRPTGFEVADAVERSLRGELGGGSRRVLWLVGVVAALLVLAAVGLTGGDGPSEVASDARITPRAPVTAVTTPAEGAESATPNEPVGSSKPFAVEKPPDLAWLWDQLVRPALTAEETKQLERWAAESDYGNLARRLDPGRKLRGRWLPPPGATRTQRLSSACYLLDNSPRSWSELGERLVRGVFRPDRDLPEATSRELALAGVKLLERAARAGELDAPGVLATAFLPRAGNLGLGVGVEPDDRRAAGWFFLSLKPEQKDRQGRVQLQIDSGLTLPHTDDEAWEWVGGR